MANYRKGYKCEMQVSRAEMKEYSEFFKNMRTSINFTQPQMAKELGVHLTTYSRWELSKTIPREDIDFIVDCIKTIVKRENRRLAEI